MWWIIATSSASAPREIRAQGDRPTKQWKTRWSPAMFSSWSLVIGAVFINHPPFLREAIMIGAAIVSYITTGKQAHESNHFTLGPIKEVAILFVGIFATMMPALDWLQENAANLQAATPGFFFWGSGLLSSVLDNAPTYLCFLKAAFGRFVPPDVVDPGGVNPGA